MKPFSQTTKQRLVAQGFDLSDDEIVAFNYWLRLAPAICMLWVLAGLALGSTFMIAALIPVGLLCFALARHPFDAIYNYGLRFLTGGEKLPLYGAPRRFVCLMAAMILAAIALSFGFGLLAVGYTIGISMVAMLLLNVVTGNCGPCAVYNHFVGPANSEA
jgi:hypothetical protein